ncbi:MAG: EAL domain-containing protein, partial [Jatrophihabitans sp.]|uniref:EAL domain-containing protein n=1 Tax=Jatrophihabitans sp. TaxID=1932789 RepID=UPI003F818501
MRLREAVAAGEVVPHYQPIVELGTGRIVGAEALARWPQPDGGCTPPDVFVPLAEQSGLIATLGTAVLRRACADAAGWPAASASGRPAPLVAVNVSGAQLVDPGFPDTVAVALRDAGLAPDRLVLEVTESTADGDDPQAVANLHVLRERGVRIAIDDLGTGYSNLARLAALPVDILKVDQGFVRQLETHRNGAALLETFVLLARRIGTLCVVEGIETGWQAEFVTRCGADRG